MATSKTVLVLGGGVGGVIAARALRKRLPREHRVILVERERRHVFSPSLIWVMVGLREPEAISRPLDGLRAAGVEVKLGEIERIEPEARKVTVSGEVLEADHLVVALGADLAPENIPGLAEAGHNLYCLDGARSFRDALRELGAGKLVIMTAAPAYKCPAAPYESALLSEHFLRTHGSSAKVEVWAAEPGPMGVAGPAVSAAVKQMLADRGIPYHPEHQVTRVDAAAKRIEFANGASTEVDLLGYVPPHRAPKVVKDAGLLADSGWVSVDRHTLATRFPGVYALGDVVAIPLALGKPLPKAGVFAHGQAEVVAHNIACAITGHGAPRRFDGHGTCFIEVGGGKAGYGGGDFYAEPLPVVKLRAPAWHFHLGKVLFEKAWLHLKL